MSKKASGKSRRRKERQESPQFNVYYVGLPLLGVGFIFLIVAFVVPKGPGMGVLLLLAAGCLGTGGYLCCDKFFKKRLEFGEEAVLMYRCRDNKLIGQIPYANIARAEIDDLNG